MMKRSTKFRSASFQNQGTGIYTSAANRKSPLPKLMIILTLLALISFLMEEKDLNHYLFERGGIEILAAAGVLAIMVRLAIRMVAVAQPYNQKSRLQKPWPVKRIL